HRITQIQENTDSRFWRHVRSDDNPADALSRGQLPSIFLKIRTWFFGPSWLAEEEHIWPHEIISLKEIPELKKNTCLVSTTEEFNADSTKYKMGDLPKPRICNANPFANTGIDYCGPFYIKKKKHRNRNRVKVYVCVFICMAVKAVLLEIVSDLSTDGFLAALRRFIARRGIPEQIYSDNGTNFKCANNHLKELYVLLNSDEHRNKTSRFAVEHHIAWHFISPTAPHFGGLWESTVKLFKHHFKRVVRELLFTFEELNTFTIEIEGILNSRPISYISSDPNDPLVLTPAHCLIGRPLINMPEPNLSSVPANRLSTWQHISKVRQDFWSRWSLEYLNELQIRRKWIKDEPNLNIGSIVLLKERNIPVDTVI
ncbi:PREDICTED: uncharacterized protein LOC105568687, partial [Vollenhovia emeryi]|uniref:uncharacterized protein LOC105568687 n=1 Tax=Vollenhovia emeryi TaxID=411798 RepID=UPI0005F51B7B